VFIKKLIILVTPLIVAALLCVVYPLIPEKWGFYAGLLRGLLIGLGIGSLLPLVFGARKHTAPRRLLWLPAGGLALLLLFQCLTHADMLRIPALSFLFSVSGSQCMLEMAVLTFLSSVLFITRK
jgi:L-cystine uptake protein TcyP (sodium:dicarboxylate symporter family)